jgi:hypothetical protein
MGETIELKPKKRATMAKGGEWLCADACAFLLGGSGV